MKNICLYCDFFIIEEQYRTIEFINIDHMVQAYILMACSQGEDEIEISPTAKPCEHYSIGGIQYGLGS